MDTQQWKWFQAISFQLIWLTTVLGGNAWLPFAIALLCGHFFFSPSRKLDARVLLLAFLGITVDSVLTAFGVFQLAASPAWLYVLWCGFVRNFGHSLQFLRAVKVHWLVPIGA